MGSTLNLALHAAEPFSRMTPVTQALYNGVVGEVSGNPAVASGQWDLSQFYSLLQEQTKVQQEMQLISLSSNLEKSKHETSMAPIRNTRVS